jgi:hypothetical protein
MRMTLTAFTPAPVATGLDRYRPDLSVPLSLEQLVASLRTICAATRSATGGRPLKEQISQSTEHALVSTLKAAVRASTIGTLDIRPVLPDLARHAHAAAQQSKVSNPSEAASRARRVVRLVTGMAADGRKLHAPMQFLGDGWGDLVTHASRRQERSKLVVLARTLTAMRAFDAPAAIPALADIRDFALRDDAPYSWNSVRNAISAYRRVRTRAVLADTTRAICFAEAPRLPDPRARTHSALSLPAEGAQPTLRGLERLHAGLVDTFPAIAEEIKRFRDLSPGTPASQVWQNTVATAVGRQLAVIEQLYAQPSAARVLPTRSDLRLWHFYSTYVPGGGTVEADGGFFTAVAPVSERRQLLARALALIDAETAREVSPFAAGASSEWMPQTVVRTECAIWSVVSKVYGSKIDAEAFVEQRQRRHSLMKWLHENGPGAAERSGREMDKVWLIEHLSFPLLVCVGLPWLAAAARARRDEWQHLVRHGAPDDILATAYMSYAFALHDYVGMAVAADDGMRRKNYTNAVIGRHVRLTYTGGVLTMIKLTFGTDREDPACLKITERGPRGRRVRVEPHVHTISPGVVDHELFDRWVREVAPGFSYTRPQPPHEGHLSVEDCAGMRLFPSGVRAEYAQVRPGGSFASRMHDTLFAIIRLLHGDAVPATRAELPLAQRAACTLHRIRLLLTSYWGGVRDDWKHAMHLTSDTESTLREHYTVSVSNHIRDQLARQQNSWHHPRWFDGLMDDLRAGQTFEWTQHPLVHEIIATRGGWPTPSLGRIAGVPVRRWKRPSRRTL